MKIRPLALVGAVILLLFLAYTAWWASAAARLRVWVQDWVETQRAAGAKLDYAGLEIGGFPLELRAHAREITLVLPDGTAWSARALHAASVPWEPLTIHLKMPSSQHLFLPAAGARPPLDMTARTATGTLDLSPAGALRSARLWLEAPTLGIGGGTDTDMAGLLTAATLNLTLDRPETPPATHADAGLFLTLELSKMGLPDDAPLDRTLEHMSIDLRIMGSPPESLEAQAVRAWSESGGIIELDRFAADWGQMNLTGNATLALDGALQPMGAGTAYIRGFDRAVDALADVGNLRPNEAAMAKAALGMLAQPGPDGVPTVQAPVSLQDRRLSIGPLIIARLPPIEWE